MNRRERIFEIWLASSTMTTSKYSVDSGNVSATLSGLINQTGFKSRE